MAPISLACLLACLRIREIFRSSTIAPTTDSFALLESPTCHDRQPKLHGGRKPMSQRCQSFQHKKALPTNTLPKYSKGNVVARLLQKACNDTGVA